MNYQEIVNNLDRETIQKLQTAVEIGRWENGTQLTQKQRDDAMQAVMLWQSKYQVVADNEPFKVNDKGEFSVGKGTKLKDVPLEHRSADDSDLIYKSKA